MKLDMYQVTWIVLLVIILVVFWRRQRSYNQSVVKREQAIGKLLSYFLDLEEEVQEEFYDTLSGYQEQSLRAYIRYLKKGRPVVFTRITPEALEALYQLLNWLELGEKEGKYVGFLSEEYKGYLA